VDHSDAQKYLKVSLISIVTMVVGIPLSAVVLIALALIGF
jgi:hypothetical protein